MITEWPDGKFSPFLTKLTPSRVYKDLETFAEDLRGALSVCGNGRWLWSLPVEAVGREEVANVTASSRSESAGNSFWTHLSRRAGAAAAYCPRRIPLTPRNRRMSGSRLRPSRWKAIGTSAPGEVYTMVGDKPHVDHTIREQNSRWLSADIGVSHSEQGVGPLLRHVTIHLPACRVVKDENSWWIAPATHLLRRTRCIPISEVTLIGN